jgi:hypothetical protein
MRGWAGYAQVQVGTGSDALMGGEREAPIQVGGAITMLSELTYSGECAELHGLSSAAEVYRSIDRSYVCIAAVE